jgi:hypothetical protein
MHNMHTMNTKKFKTVRMSSRWQIIAYMIHMPHVLLVSYQYQIRRSFKQCTQNCKCVSGHDMSTVILRYDYECLVCHIWS